MKKKMTRKEKKEIRRKRRNRALLGTAAVTAVTAGAAAAAAYQFTFGRTKIGHNLSLGTRSDEFNDAREYGAYKLRELNPEIYEICPERAVYIVGYDVPQPHRGVRMNPGECQGFGPVEVKAFGSTDEGVSFLVKYAGITLFHAGDLNLWHWRDENPISEIEAAEKLFYECVETIPSSEIDVAFFPVDPRQGSMHDAGAGYFIMTVKPKIFIPMHFQGRPDVALRFAATGETLHTRVVAMQQAGELGHSTEREIIFLCVHSVLHLLGYDHETSNEDEEEMFQKQREIMKRFN